MLTLTHKFYIIGLKMMSRTFFKTFTRVLNRHVPAVQTSRPDIIRSVRQKPSSKFWPAPVSRTFKMSVIITRFYFNLILSYHLAESLSEGHVKREAILHSPDKTRRKTLCKHSGPVQRPSEILFQAKEENL